jgi:ribosomal-protein-alanine N-acetyltransferase
VRTTTRLVRPQDAERFTELVQANREFLAPWDPVRPAEYYTLQGQRDTIELLLRAHADGAAVPLTILGDDEIVGRVTLSNIVRGALQSCSIGYWLAEAANGRGHATRAVAQSCELAFAQLGLHRVEAGTLVANVRSQAVLQRTGFRRFGLAPQYLKIAGRWQDHLLFQRLSDAE